MRGSGAGDWEVEQEGPSSSEGSNSDNGREERRVSTVARFCSWVDGGGALWEVGKWEAGLG